MRFVRFIYQGRPMLGLREDGKVRTLGPEALESLLSSGEDLGAWVAARLSGGELIETEALRFLPPLPRPPKILCVGLNYLEHTNEVKLEQPTYPTLFTRFATSLVGHNEPILRPQCSAALDYEGEMAVVIARGGRHISKETALEHVFGYAVFNDGSIRDYQFRTPQWTMGKNFDATGGFGPDVVTADELPPGGRGLQVETRLNGNVVQSASTDDMIFDVPTLISLMSEVLTLEPGDVIVSGTPAGIGWAREPRLLMKHGDVCEVSITGIGTLVNPIVDETA